MQGVQATGKRGPPSEKSTWAAEYKHLNKQVRQAESHSGSKLLSFCQTTTLKADVLRMAEAQERLVIDISFGEDKLLKDIREVQLEVRGWRQALMHPIRDEAYFVRAERGAENIQRKIDGLKTAGREEFQALEEDRQQLEEDLGRIEEHLHIYEQKVQIDDDEVETEHADNRRPGPTQVRKVGLDEPGDTGTQFKVDALEELVAQRTPLGQDYRVCIQELLELKKKTDEINKEIEENGGLNCGWTSGKDHKEYCLLRVKHKGRTESIPFFEECQIVLPLYSQSEIRSHTNAYNIFMKLDNARKEMLSNYKELKEKKKKLEAAYRAELLSLEQKAKEVDPVKEQLERQRKKELIERWKQEKEVQKVIGVDKIEQKLEVKTKNEREKLAKEQEEKKKMIQQYKEKKAQELEDEMQRIRLQQVEQRKRFQSEDQKTRVLQKQQDMLAKIAQQVEEKKAAEKVRREREEQEQLEKQRKLEGVQSKLHYMPATIQERARQKFDPTRDQPKHADSMGGVVVRTTGRALGGWMGK